MMHHIRHLAREDHPDVLGIERLSFHNPWTQSTLLQHLFRTPLAAMVAEAAVPVEGIYPVLGYLLYQPLADRFDVRRLAVHPDYRRLGVGRSLLDRLAGRLVDTRRSAVTLTVPDTNLDAHLWLRACGFRAERVEFVRGGGPDLYDFAYRLPVASASDPSSGLEWWSLHWRERATAAIRAEFGGEPIVADLDALLAAAQPRARCLPSPTVAYDPAGWPRLIWVRQGRSVHLLTGADSWFQVVVTPGPMPHHLIEVATTAECLARCLDWLYGTGAPAPLPPIEAEDRGQC